MSIPPKVENAPGLTWRTRKVGWEARWQCRTDLAQRGFEPKTVRLGHFTEPPTRIEEMWIQDKCNALQAEMLVWGRGGLPQVSRYDGTLASLIQCYATDKDSPIHKLRYASRRHYARLFDMLENVEWEHDGITRRAGDTLIKDIKARTLLRWHEIWMDQGKVAMAHAVMAAVRILSGFGATILEDEECSRLSGVLSQMRFKSPKSRTVNLTAQQATDIRRVAHEQGAPSVALAQALQFDLTLRQKDVIGEWVPMSEPGISDTFYANNKWLRGLRWEEIDANLILRHVTSKRQKEITIDLKHAVMVMEELALAYGKGFTRADLPANGPVIVSYLGRPYDGQSFRWYWRKAATAAGVPAHIRNMDTRAGAITEATEAGVPLEHVRAAATHSDIGMTQKYSRGEQEKIASVMQKRAEFRKNKSGVNE